MNKIWEILNIEPTKDKAAIKRAYALLARKYNPEDEPEKYQELHEASFRKQRRRRRRKR